MHGTLLQSLRSYERACFERLRANPGDPDALFTQAAVLRLTGHRTAAVACLDTLSLIAPHYPGLWRFKARLYREAGNQRMEVLCIRRAEQEESAEEGRAGTFLASRAARA